MVARQAVADAILDWRTFAPLPTDPVLDAAIELFVRYGYHGATVRQIADRAKLSVPGIYHYYATKQDMLVRILDLGMDEILARIDVAIAEAGDDVIRRFENVVECLALSMTYRLDISLIGTSEMRSLEKKNYGRVAKARTKLQRAVDTVIDDGIAAGRMGTPLPRDAARAIVTMATSIPQWYRVGGPLTPEDLAARYVAIGKRIVECD